MAVLETPFVRSLFPAFGTEEIADNAYFSHAAGTFPCLQVMGRLARYYRTRRIDPYSPFVPSQEAGEEVDEARQRLAALLGVASDELVFGASTAMNTYVLAQAFAEVLAPGDAIVVTDQDHEANSGVWRRLEHRGVELREWHIDRTSGHLSTEALADLLDENVRLVCFPHVSPVVGEINPVARICAMARDVGALTCVDGAASAAHGLPDVDALGADIYLWSAHKAFGPHQGIMVIRRALAAVLPNQGHFFNAHCPDGRLNPGSPDYAQIAACCGIADYFQALHDHHFGTDVPAAELAADVSGLIRQQEDLLVAPLIDFLAYRNSVRLLGPRDAGARVSTVSVLHDRPAAELQGALARQGVMTGAGHLGSVRTLRAMGIEPERGVLSLSLLHYNSTYEVERLIDTLDRVI